MAEQEDERQGVQAVDVAFHIAEVLAQAHYPQTFGEIASKLPLPASKIHRYLVSLCRSNIASQNPLDGRYSIGGGAIMLGLAGQRMLDEYRHLDEALCSLRNQTGHTTAAAIWGTNRPVVIRRLEAMDSHASVGPRIGATVSVVGSASGRVFAGFMPNDVIEPVIESEIKDGIVSEMTGAPFTLAEYRELIASVREQEFATGTFGSFDIETMAVPIFAADDRLIFVLGMVVSQQHGKKETFVREALIATRQRLEAALGRGPHLRVPVPPAATSSRSALKSR